jgi:hypothetical protein
MCSSHKTGFGGADGTTTIALERLGFHIWSGDYFVSFNFQLSAEMDLSQQGFFFAASSV